MRFIRPTLDLVYQAALNFLKYWRGQPWPRKLALFPAVPFALLYVGFYLFFFSCNR